MCGIVGLFLKDRSLEPQLGALLARMLEVMTERGPDSAGFAVYGSGDAGHIKLTLRGSDLADIVAAIELDIGAGVTGVLRDSHLVLSLPVEHEEYARAWLALNRPDVVVIGAGHRIELYKEVGLPADVSTRFGHERQPWHRPHPHGHGKRGHHRWRASFLHRRGSVPRAQWLAV